MAMKQKPDEFPDQWVRQTLSQLPDAPPPGSSFNSDHLWTKLRPELQPVAAPRSQTRLIGWLAAACLGALVFGWGWLSYRSAPEPSIAIVHRKAPEAHVSPPQHSGLTRAKELDGAKRIVSAAERPRVAVHTHTAQPVRSATEVTPPVATAVALPSPMREDGLTLAEAPAVVDKLPALAVPKVAQMKPKRRFQVVHENELRAEEEAQPKLYRPDHFVRLGSGQVEEPGPGSGRPALIMSLTNKPNQ